ncbi:uncharacterized protein PITG_19761 [Phytophthora infestans T30-4]|uniref:Uncharacterized protein n=1 Tax=Phytophthora infestans (strain T30-4) TaxID=403677 RepID=D0P163_PHYIT|nr:uncharacterized protein PITG_19761 [Phytophthora infestans T30-4]EEY54084.1 conserved hypothetical protein [Phytophthora infestans T30-4]|eukprot:XP_002895968.1 conserved hypothetical protein [Phytophthora infestans T30-4]
MQQEGGGGDKNGGSKDRKELKDGRSEGDISSGRSVKGCDVLPGRAGGRLPVGTGIPKRYRYTLLLLVADHTWRALSLRIWKNKQQAVKKYPPLLVPFRIELMEGGDDGMQQEGGGGDKNGGSKDRKELKDGRSEGDISSGRSVKGCDVLPGRAGGRLPVGER